MGGDQIDQMIDLEALLEAERIIFYSEVQLGTSVFLVDDEFGDD